MLHPGPRLYPRFHRDLARPRSGVGSPAHLLGRVHDAANGGRDRLRRAVAADVRERVQLDNAGKRGAADIVRHVQRPEHAVRCGVMYTSKYIFTTSVKFLFFLFRSRFVFASLFFVVSCIFVFVFVFCFVFFPVACFVFRLLLLIERGPAYEKQLMVLRGAEMRRVEM